MMHNNGDYLAPLGRTQQPGASPLATPSENFGNDIHPTNHLQQPSAGGYHRLEHINDPASSRVQQYPFPTSSLSSSSYRHSDPMDRIVHNLHHQCCKFALQRTNHTFRSLLERCLLIIAVCGFGAIFLAHATFVYRNNSYFNEAISSTTSSQSTTISDWNDAAISAASMERKNVSYLSTTTSSTASSITSASFRKRNIPVTCLPSIDGFDIYADVTHVIVLDKNVASTTIAAETETTTLSDERQQYSPLSFVYHKYNKFNETATSQEGPDATGSTLLSQLMNSSYNNAKVYFSFSRIEAYVYMTPDLCEKHHIHEQYIFVSSTDPFCFGEPFLQMLVFRLLGPDTVIVNWLLALSNRNSAYGLGQGFIYNPRSGAVIDLSAQFEDTDAGYNNNAQADQRSSYLFRWYHQISSKLCLCTKTAFLFFITTTLVKFTLRETQGLMLDFTHQLQQNVRAGQPIGLLVTRHLIESLVFVPIMVGVMFFLIELYRGDKFLGFMVLSLIWVVEAFSVISLHTRQGTYFFPRIFFLLFAVFHIYHFSFPFGFSYTAFATLMCSLLHTMVLFWHRFELLAAARFSGRHNLPPNGDTLSPQETQNSSARFGFPLVPSTSDGNGVEHSLAATPVGGDRRTSTRAMSMPNEHDDRADDWSSNASEELTRSMLSLLHDGSPFPSSANLAPRLTPYSRPRHDSHANNGTSGVTSSFIYQENTEDMHSHVDARDFILANNESIFEQLHNDIYISRADRESYDRHQFQPIRQSFGHVSPSSSMGSVTERRIDAHTEPVSLDERRHNDANTRDRGVRSPTLNGENETSALRSILFSSGDSFFTTDSTSNGAT